MFQLSVPQPAQDCSVATNGTVFGFQAIASSPQWEQTSPLHPLHAQQVCNRHQVGRGVTWDNAYLCNQVLILGGGCSQLLRASQSKVSEALGEAERFPLCVSEC